MNIPGFTADASFRNASRSYQMDTSYASVGAGGVLPQLGFGGFGGFGPTLPSCHYEQQRVVCGSSLPGYPAPMCLEWVYVCRFPGAAAAIS